MTECREHPRIPVELPVFFSTTESTDLREGTMFDISAGGCAVTSMVAVKPGDEVTLVIRTTGSESPITVHSAQVRWASHGEFGVEFTNLAGSDRNRLKHLLHIAVPRPIPQHRSPAAA